MIPFIWNGASPRVAKTMLNLPPRLCGLVLPNFQVYFWAAMLVSVYLWFQGSSANAATCLRAAFLGSLMDLRNLIYRGPRAYRFLPGPTHTTFRIWRAATRRLSTSGQLSPAQPLWGNPGLPHFHTVPDPQFWARHGVKTIGDIMPAGTLLSFPVLSQKF